MTESLSSSSILGANPPSLDDSMVDADLEYDPDDDVVTQPEATTTKKVRGIAKVYTPFVCFVSCEDGVQFLLNEEVSRSSRS
jgi:hypothetical protein